MRIVEGDDRMTNSTDLLASFNRVVLALGSLFMLSLAAVGVRDSRALVATLQIYLDALGRIDPASVKVAALGVGVVALVVFLFEAWPRWRRPVFESRIDGGIVEYSTQVVADSVNRDLLTVDGVGDHHVEVTGRGNKVWVKIRIHFERDNAPATIASQASARVRESVKHLGLEVETVRLVIEPIAERSDLPARQAQTAV
jgi:hypothetical protein